MFFVLFLPYLDTWMQGKRKRRKSKRTGGRKKGRISRSVRGKRVPSRKRRKILIMRSEK